MASFITPPVGYLFDRHGARITLAAGAGLNLLGWVGLYFIFIWASTIDPSSSSPPSGGGGVLGSNITTLIIILIVFSLSQMSSPFYEQGSVLANLQGLSTHRGKVVLIQKTFMGLGSGLISQLYSTFFVDDDTKTTSKSETTSSSYPALENLGYFCLLLAVYSVITGLLGALVTNVPKGRNAASLRVPGINNAPTATIVSSVLPRSISNNNNSIINGVAGVTELPSSSSATPLPLSVVVSTPITSPSNPTSPTETLPIRVDSSTTTMMSPTRFAQLNNEEIHLAKQFDSYFRPATLLTLLLVALIAIITVVDTYWSTSIKEEAESSDSSSTSSAGFDAWQLWSSILSMGLCALFLPMVYLVPLRVVTTSVNIYNITSSITSPISVDDNDDIAANPSPHQPREQQQQQQDAWGRGGNLSDLEPQEEEEDVGDLTPAGDDTTTMSITKKKKNSSSITSVDMGDDHQQIHTTPYNGRLTTTSPQPSTSKAPTLRKFELNTFALKVNLLSSPNWWFLWLQCFCVWGVATLVSTNSSQIYYALDPSGYSDTTNAAMVSIFGVASALGRVVVGALVGTIQGWKTPSTAGENRGRHDNLPQRTNHRRRDGGSNNNRNETADAATKRPLLVPSSSVGGDTQQHQQQSTTTVSTDEEGDNMSMEEVSSSSSWRIWLAHQNEALIRRFRSNQADELIPIYFLLVPSFILSIGLPLFLLSPPGMLLVCFFLVGFAAGFTYGSVILVVSGLLSQEHAGKHYGFVGSAGFATPILFNIVIFAQTYDEVGGSQAGFAANNNQCVGRECLFSSLLVSTALCVLSFLLMVVLVRRVVRDGRI